MARDFFKRYIPKKSALVRHPHLGFLAAHLQASELWRLTRRSVAGGVAVGLFVAFLPIPFQMVLAAAVALVLRVNVPVALLAVWVTNPFTLTPIGYLAYRTGSWLLDTPSVASVPDETTFRWLMSQTARVWRPLLAGGLFLGTTASALGYVAVRIGWRLHVAYRWRRRSGGGASGSDLRSPQQASESAQRSAGGDTGRGVEGDDGDDMDERVESDHTVEPEKTLAEGGER